MNPPNTNPHALFPLAGEVAELVATLEAEYAEALDMGVDVEFIKSDAEFDKLKSIEKLSGVFDGLGEAILLANGEAKRMKELSDTFKEKERLAKNRAERLKKLVAQLLEHAGMLDPSTGTGSHKGALTVAVQKNGGVAPLEILRELDDDEYAAIKESHPSAVDVTYSLNKPEVRLLLGKGGEDAYFPEIEPFAKLGERGTSVRVR